MVIRLARVMNSCVYTLLEVGLICWKLFIFAASALLLCVFVGLTPFYSVLGSFLLYVVTGGWRFARIIYKTIGRDFRALLCLIDIQSALKKYESAGDNVVTLFQKTVLRHPDKTTLVLVDDRCWTFREVDEFSNAVANYFHNRGYRKGDVIAIFMESGPEFIVIWLGLAKIGVVSALINFNLRREILISSINTSSAKSLIFGAAFREAVYDIREFLPSNFALYCSCDRNCQGNGLQVIHLDHVLKMGSTLPPPKDHITLLNDKLFYIYTSGTTGVPKAASLSHARFLYLSRTIYVFYKLTPDDIIYNTLPLYHVTGGVLGVGNSFVHGCTVVLRKRFSASRFWDDCCRYNCTTAQYIGEICRFLLAQPQKPTERQHKVKTVFGNGLRPQIWEEFRQRFKIDLVGEFYGATEGNANMLNPDNTLGAVGFQSRILPFVYPVSLVKVDKTTGALLRNRRGLCIECQPGEPGQLIGKIVKTSPLRRFDGYTNEEASRKKIASNVFWKGDCYFLSGDILEMDEYGYFYFHDRTGDTFRWRGENVSTVEVESIVSKVTKLRDAAVYGVEIPGNEGRAGMLAIADEDLELDLKQLNRELKKRLPRYAQPLFIRITKKLDMTETFKPRKTEYKKDGFNPSIIRDHLFYMDPSSGEYQPLDPKTYADICTCQIQM